jgi:hypothetical protein
MNVVIHGTEYIFLEENFMNVVYQRNVKHLFKGRKLMNVIINASFKGKKSPRCSHRIQPGGAP